MNDLNHENHYDVVLVGGGQAGLSLARHLLLETDKTILLLERRKSIPPRRQKVGESMVQVAGYYYSRVLDLEEHLFRRHFPKYNLRFYWKNGEGTRFEEYSQGYIRNLSNILSYQIDRNVFEEELLRLNREDPRFTCRMNVKIVDTELAQADDRRHQVTFEENGTDVRVECDWFVDTSGRSKYLKRRKKLERGNEIHHGSFFWWVEGLVNVEGLTDLSRLDIRKKPQRRLQGHFPTWLATNQFLSEGMWFWIIPLHGKTSLGLVYDNNVVSHDDVFSVEKATRWVCEKFPCFARDLPHRKVLDYGGFKSFSYDCAQTLHPSRWAIAGEAGRFSDPLYSPGSDLIAFHNTLIVDAIRTEDPEDLRGKCNLYEQLLRAAYQAYIPSYSDSYDALGDQETFCLKYAWELTVYFAGYVFPFINDFFTDRRFLLAFFRLFSRLGPVNRRIQSFLSGYYQWKKANGIGPPAEPIFFEFTEIAALREAEKTFYEVGVSIGEAKQILARQVAHLEELARFIAAQITSVVVDDARVLTSRRFVSSIDLNALVFDPEALRERWARCLDDGVSPPRSPHGDGGDSDTHRWSFDPAVMMRFHPPSTERTAPVPEAAR